MNSFKNSSLLPAVAVTTGGVVFAFANASFTAAIPAEIIMSICASLGLLGIAASDYGRANRSLTPLATLLRPVWNKNSAKSTRAMEGNANNSDRLAA